MKGSLSVKVLRAMNVLLRHGYEETRTTLLQPPHLLHELFIIRRTAQHGMTP